ncbi:MAG: hypothetical protein GY778_05545 [bacterium]|nr:hypothetical protein [bacterium]
MTIKKSCSLGLVLLSLAAGGGCAGMTQGKLLYFLGFGAGRKADAEFELTRDGPVLVLVDDYEEVFDSGRTPGVLADLVGKELIEQKATDKVVPPARLAKARREDQGYENRGAREIGERLGAHQVVWLEAREYYAPKDVEEIAAAARLSVTVKVLNALETENRARVRLWPTERQGRMVTVELNANEMVRAEKPELIAKLLCAKMAVEVTKLFYDYPLGDFE